MPRIERAHAAHAGGIHDSATIAYRRRSPGNAIAVSGCHAPSCQSTYQPATFSTQAGPQICSTAALNSRSGRTFAGTSSSTEKSRGASSRRPHRRRSGLALEKFFQCRGAVHPAIAADPDADGDHAGKIDARIIQRHDILHGKLRRRVLFGKHQAADHHRRVFHHLARQPFVVGGEAAALRCCRCDLRVASRTTACLRDCVCA